LKREQAVQVRSGPQVNRSAMATIAAVRTASWHVLFAAERSGPVSAVAGFDPDSGTVDKHLVPTNRLFGTS
jgi:hypothetical protein